MTLQQIWGQGWKDVDESSKDLYALALTQATGRNAQLAKDRDRLEGRAKDVLGFTAIITGVAKVVGKEPYLKVAWTRGFVCAAVGFVISVVACLVVLWPRRQWHWFADSTVLAERLDAGLSEIPPVHPTAASLNRYLTFAIEDYETTNAANIHLMVRLVYVAIIGFVIEASALLLAAVHS